MKQKERNPKFNLRFNHSEFDNWAKKYNYKSRIDIEGIASKIIDQGHLTRDQLISVCHWKTPRSKQRVANNEEGFVQEITKFALSSKDERCRIESLTLLNGVSWPSASVILHFCHKERYPILDFRALESFGIFDNIKYDFDLWWSYTQQCRQLSDQYKLDMRTIDKALWQYSKETF